MIRSSTFSFLLAVSILVSVSSLHAQTQSVWDGSTGDWSDASKWSSSNAPDNVLNGESFDVEISAGNVNLDIGPTIDSLTLSGGEITGSNDIFVEAFNGTGEMHWTGGTISGGEFATTTVDSDLTISGSAPLVLDRSLNAFNIDWQANDVLSTGSGRLTTFGSNFLITGGGEDRVLEAAYSGDSLTHDRDGKTVFAGSNFQNFFNLGVDRGTVEVLSDDVFASSISFSSSSSTLRILGGGIHSVSELAGGTGNFEIENGTTVIDGSFNNGRLKIGENATFELLGAGSNSADSILNQGTLQSFTGGVSITTNSFVNEGVISFDTSSTVDISRLDQNSGAINVMGFDPSGSLRTSEAININGGSLNGHGYIEGDVNIGTAGIVSPSSGILNIDGDAVVAGIFDLGIRGRLVGGAQQDSTLINSGSDVFGIEFDQVNVFGTVTLEGGSVFDLTFDNREQFQAGDFFDILTGDTIVADQSQLVFNTDIFQYSTDILTLNDPGLGTRQTLRFTVIQAVPEPSGTLILISILLGGFARRKRIG